MGNTHCAGVRQKCDNFIKDCKDCGCVDRWVLRNAMEASNRQHASLAKGGKKGVSSKPSVYSTRSTDFSAEPEKNGQVPPSSESESKAGPPPQTKVDALTGSSFADLHTKAGRRLSNGHNAAAAHVDDVNLKPKAASASETAQERLARIYAEQEAIAKQHHVGTSDNSDTQEPEANPGPRSAHDLLQHVYAQQEAIAKQHHTGVDNNTEADDSDAVNGNGEGSASGQPKAETNRERIQRIYAEQEAIAKSNNPEV